RERPPRPSKRTRLPAGGIRAARCPNGRLPDRTAARGGNGRQPPLGQRRQGPGCGRGPRMILSDRETRAARVRGAIRITPEPAPAAWSSTAVDLTLDGPLSRWEVPRDQAAQLVISPHGVDFDFAALSRQFGREVPLDERGHVVEPFAFVLGWTVERIQL